MVLPQTEEASRVLINKALEASGCDIPRPRTSGPFRRAWPLQVDGKLTFSRDETKACGRVACVLEPASSSGMFPEIAAKN